MIRVVLLAMGLCVGLNAFAAQSVPGLPPGYVPSNEEEISNFERARVHTDLGAQYYAAGNIGVALEEFNIAAAVERRYVPAHYMLGLVYMELKDDAQAEAHFRRALDLDGSNSEARNNYGWFLCQRGKVGESIREFMAALKNPLYDTPDKPYVNAGLCTLKLKDDQGAEEYFLKALKLRPNQPQALLALADIYLRAGDYPNARAQMLVFMKAHNPTPEALWLGVRIERKLSDRASESSYAQMLRQRFPVAKETQALAAGRYE